MPFVKNDPRINRAGRPKGSYGVRTMLKELAGEKMAYKGVTMSKAQVILLKVIEGAIGGDIQSQRLYMEYMYGKPTQHVAVEASVALPDRTTQRDLLLMEHFSGKEVESESYPV